MTEQIHILNGDSLKQQFPKDITGERIVARECLVDGTVEGKNLDELFANRAKFISTGYGENEQVYYNKSVPQFRKILSIDSNSDINLWFEDDLFCQVNFWFVLHLLSQSKATNRLFLIRPESHNQYGFSGLTESQLLSLYENKTELTDLTLLSGLWEYYQSGKTSKLLELAKQLKTLYPFILNAVEAHIQRIPINGKEGRPKESLITIMQELNTEEFVPVFKEFNKRESIYGFGDLQVKRLYDEILNKA